MEEHAPKSNNTYILPPKGRQVPNIVEGDEVDQNKLNPGAEEDYYSYDEQSYGENSDTESEFDDDEVIPETQDCVIYPKSNGGRVLNIWSHSWINFVNDRTITAQNKTNLKVCLNIRVLMLFLKYRRILCNLANGNRSVLQNTSTHLQ